MLMQRRCRTSAVACQRVPAPIRRAALVWYNNHISGKPVGINWFVEGENMTKQHCLAVALTGVFGAIALFAASTTVELKNAKGESVGTATITENKGGKGGLTIKLTAKNLPPGVHAFHIHQTAKCEAPGFTTAGGHFNPESSHHGINNPATPHPHAGDMNNFTVKANGTAKVTFTDMAVNMGSDNHSIYSNGGTALVIHAQADDLKSDPSGNAGDRIACGVITK
jgi:superoxide dismutase, Cu-Zn family